jgi:selenocysteine lyase/cysteine desulfurase
MCHTHIDLTQLNVHGYLSNFHKWAFAPKNAAFLYISDKYL